ncbi:MAG: hypothetical protein IT209_04500 [Armatimonadetes bacterium]|nr:hypothetical protein [Armatimonadota bacterium]
MTDFTQPHTFDSRAQGFKELQQSNFKLWQWLDNVTTVWWGPGRQRVVSQEKKDGTFLTQALPPLDWRDTSSHVGTVASPGSGDSLIEKS